MALPLCLKLQILRRVSEMVSMPMPVIVTERERVQCSYVFLKGPTRPGMPEGVGAAFFPVPEEADIRRGRGREKRACIVRERASILDLMFGSTARIRVFSPKPKEQSTAQVQLPLLQAINSGKGKLLRLVRAHDGCAAFETRLVQHGGQALWADGLRELVAVVHQQHARAADERTGEADLERRLLSQWVPGSLADQRCVAVLRRGR